MREWYRTELEHVPGSQEVGVDCVLRVELGLYCLYILYVIRFSTVLQAAGNQLYGLFLPKRKQKTILLCFILLKKNAYA